MPTAHAHHPLPLTTFRIPDFPLINSFWNSSQTYSKVSLTKHLAASQSDWTSQNLPSPLCAQMDPMKWSRSSEGTGFLTQPVMCYVEILDYEKEKLRTMQGKKEMTDTALLFPSSARCDPPNQGLLCVILPCLLSSGSNHWTAHTPSTPGSNYSSVNRHSPYSANCYLKKPWSWALL